MTTTLCDDRPVEASRSSCGSCESSPGQAPGICHDRHGRCNGTYYGCRPGFNLGRGNGHAVRGESLRLWRDRGLVSSGRTGRSIAVCTPARRSQPHPRRQVIPTPATIANCARIGQSVDPDLRLRILTH